ncbi:MAG: hypothetical protein OEY64_10485 [Nitrospinota bacterium]|nr:hypothetical protein [Nitrospinota bacterium]
MKKKNSSKKIAAFVETDDFGSGRKWALFLSFAILSLLVSLIFYLKKQEGHAGTFTGMVYGGIALTSVIFLSLYRIRRSVFSFKFGSMQWWMTGHIYVGLLAIIPVLMHTNFRLHGIFSLFFFSLFIVVIASGAIGWYLNSTLPAALTRYGVMSANENDLAGEIVKQTEEIESYLNSKAQHFKSSTIPYLHEYLQKKPVIYSRMFISDREALSRLKYKFERLKLNASPRDVYSLGILRSLLMKRENLIIRHSKHQLLRGWLNVHVPLTAALLAAALVHVTSMLYF